MITSGVSKLSLKNIHKVNLMIDSTTKIGKHNCVMELNRPCSLMRFCDCGKKPVGISRASWEWNIYRLMSRCSKCQKGQKYISQMYSVGKFAFFFLMIVVQYRLRVFFGYNWGLVSLLSLQNVKLLCIVYKFVCQLKNIINYLMINIKK